MNLLTAEEFVKQAVDTPKQDPAWLLPLIGGGVAAAGAGLITGGKREGESGRERAKRVIAAALSAGALGAGATYGAVKAKSLFDVAHNPATGAAAEPEGKSIFSSLAARLGYSGLANRGMSWFGKNRLGNYMAEKNFKELKPSQRPYLSAKNTDSFSLKNLDKSKNLRADALINRERLRTLAGAGERDFMNVFGKVGPGGSKPAREALRREMAGAGVFMKGDRLGKTVHALESLSGSPLMHPSGGLAARRFKRVGGGLLGTGATVGAYFIPEAVNLFGGKSEDAIVDGAGNYISEILPGAGKPSETPEPEKGTGGQIMDMLFKGR